MSSAICSLIQLSNSDRRSSPRPACGERSRAPGSALALSGGERVRGTLGRLARGESPSPGDFAVASSPTSPRKRGEVKSIARLNTASRFSPRISREVWPVRSALFENRGRRESRVRAAPAVSRARVCKRNAHEHTGSAEAIRPSLRNGFTAYNALSPVTGLFCHRRLRIVAANLMPASGHQDHATSPSASGALVHSAVRVHRIPLRVGDVAQRPPVWNGMAADIKVICDFGKPEYFFGRGLTRPRAASRSDLPRRVEWRQRVGWVERSDTHRLQKRICVDEADGFRGGLNPSCALRTCKARVSASRRRGRPATRWTARAIWCRCRGDPTARCSRTRATG